MGIVGVTGYTKRQENIRVIDMVGYAILNLLDLL